MIRIVDFLVKEDLLDLAIIYISLSKPNLQIIKSLARLIKKFQQK